MEIAAYLTFDGRCGEAFRFYEKCLGGKLVMLQTHGDSPMKDQVPPDWHHRVLHARLEVDGKALMGSDAPPDRYQRPQGFSVSLSVASAKDAERLFSGLADGGTVVMPLQKTFWSPGFGMAVDRFGIPWMINAEQA